MNNEKRHDQKWEYKQACLIALECSRENRWRQNWILTNELKLTRQIGCGGRGILGQGKSLCEGSEMKEDRKGSSLKADGEVVMKNLGSESLFGKQP